MQLIAEQTTGYRTIYGTAWPIVSQLWREAPRRWVVVWGLCNGIAGGSIVYRTRREALQKNAQLAGGR